jgi:hypothetical protein
MAGKVPVILLEGRKSTSYIVGWQEKYQLYCWKAGKVTDILLEGRKSNSYIAGMQEK